MKSKEEITKDLELEKTKRKELTFVYNVTLNALKATIEENEEYLSEISSLKEEIERLKSDNLDLKNELMNE